MAVTGPQEDVRKWDRRVLDAVPVLLVIACLGWCRKHYFMILVSTNFAPLKTDSKWHDLHVLQTQRPLSSQSVTEAVSAYLFCVLKFLLQREKIKFLEHKTNVSWALENMVFRTSSPSLLFGSTYQLFNIR